MGIATDVDTELTTLVEAFVTRTSTALCETLVPIALVALTIYFIVVGWRVLRGHSPDTFPTIWMKFFKAALIMTIALVGGNYQQIVIDGVAFIQNSFIESLSGYVTMGEVMDNVYEPFMNTSRDIFRRANTGVFPSITLLIGGVFVLFCGVFVLVVGLGFYFMAKVILALLIAVGPVFILCKMFEPTERFTDTWLSNVLGYVMVNVFVVAAVTMLTNFGQVFAENMGADLDIYNILTASAALVIAVFSLMVVVLNLKTLGTALTGGVDTRGVGAMVLNVITRGAMGALGRSPATGGRIAQATPPAQLANNPSPPAYQQAARLGRARTSGR